MTIYLTKFLLLICVGIILLGAIMILSMYLFRQSRLGKKNCPKCGNKLPILRIPADSYELFIGGWTCPNCKIKLTWELLERK
jgi:hypothetical protein